MRKIIATILFLSVSTALAEAGGSGSTLKDRYESGKVAGKGKLVTLDGAPEAPKLPAEVTPAPQKPAEPSTAEIVDNLVKRTRGTETSQYLEEKTSTEIPLVVASERGPGQCLIFN